jgi:uncharacterized protein (DUF3084 family)
MADTQKTDTSAQLDDVIQQLEKAKAELLEADAEIKRLQGELAKAGEPTPAVDSLYNAAAAEKSAAKREKALAAEAG